MIWYTFSLANIYLLCQPLQVLPQLLILFCIAYISTVHFSYPHICYRTYSVFHNSQTHFKMPICAILKRLQVQLHFTSSNMPLCNKYGSSFLMRSLCMLMYMGSLWSVVMGSASKSFLGFFCYCTDYPEK